MEIKRTNLMKDYPEATPIYAYDAEGEFRHSITKIRIVKQGNGWDLKTIEEGWMFEDYRTGFETKREAVEFVNDRLV